MMMVAKVVGDNFIWNCLWVLLLVSSLTRALESDVNCLRALKSQLKDPNGHLSNWVFGNKNENYICKFNGVTCWHDDFTNSVFSIDFSGFDLQGDFPDGVKECSSLVGLYLSRNNLSGTLPSDIFSLLGYLTALDLSYNSFSGKIPATWSNISYLDTLLLDHNQFTGHIPPGLASNPRLKQLSVAHNHLQGPIPEFTNGNTSLWSFEDNPDLCGFPMDPCPESFFSMAIIIAAAATAVCFPVGAVIGWLCISVGEKRKQRPTRR
ncbi:putatively inactive leucine-rich repeat receptor-like protein kinase [Cardamine amara subsp. amara]|uniref:Putatively inactive leucine-rich repeat receptor-like protein kinase n=1 Tax=Cardamine amara subsp. amara TaxID=228776 RepID=A0ABD1BCW9_CARAN